ncbi:unnamed protein product [marine sediment metagenome]|uniref:Uncharacterized protein n=1 Tax=marine sediment metagenome TaxID=412755 RepID=X1FW98_9ZZZZ
MRAIIKPRVIIAGVIVIVCIVMTALGYNSFIQSIGFIAAGFLFGSQTERPQDPNLMAAKKKVEG